jgi:hypothetical protein
MSEIDTILEGIEGIDKDTASKISTAFNEAVETKAQTIVESQLPELKKKMYRSVKERARVAFNKTASALYNETIKAVNEDAEVFKEQIVEGLESFLETYMSEAIPESLITEAAEARSNAKIVGALREVLVVEQVMTDNKMKEVMGKALDQVNNLKAENKKLSDENLSVVSENNKYKAAVEFKKLTVGMTAKQRTFLAERFKGKDAKYIKNNFPEVKKIMLETLDSGTAPANDEKKVVTEQAEQTLKDAGVKKPDAKKKEVLKEQAAASNAKRKQNSKSSDKPSVMDVLVENYIDIQAD